LKTVHHILGLIQRIDSGAFNTGLSVQPAPPCHAAVHAAGRRAREQIRRPTALLGRRALEQIRWPTALHHPPLVQHCHRLHAMMYRLEQKEKAKLESSS
jgi:hypothetical protein